KAGAAGVRRRDVAVRGTLDCTTRSGAAVPAWRLDRAGRRGYFERTFNPRAVGRPSRGRAASLQTTPLPVRAPARGEPTMLRKCMTLAAAVTAVTLAVAGIGFAAPDDESPLAKLMEKVNQKNLVITKGVRTAIAWKKDQKKVADAAGELAELGKEAR